MPFLGLDNPFNDILRELTKGFSDNGGQSLDPTGRTEDKNTMKPMTLMENRSAQNDPSTIIDDAGRAVDYQSPFSTLALYRDWETDRKSVV